MLNYRWALIAFGGVFNIAYSIQIITRHIIKISGCEMMVEMFQLDDVF